MKHKLTKELRARLAEFAAAITRPAAPAPAPRMAPGFVYPATFAPAVNHERRLLAKYEAGGWAAVELYLQPFLTPAGYARQLMERQADAKAAAAAAAPADFHPLATDEPAPVAPVVALAAADVPGYANAVHRPGAAPGAPTCEPRLPYDAAGATQRLQLAYEAGVNVPGELYEAHREVQEAPRSLCVSDNAGNCLACLQAGPGCITADFIPRYSCDCGREPAPRPLAEQICSFADELVQVIAEHKAAGTLPALGVLAGRPYDAGTDTDVPLQQLQEDICRTHCLGRCGNCALAAA